MLEARELRIGNLFLGKPVSHDDLPMVTMTVKKIEKYQGDDLINGFWWGQSDYCGWNMKDIKPIPLTEEWLVKFGFEYNGMWWDSSQEYFELDTFKDSYVMGVNSCEYNHGIEINHVHQLQNLYFALTGKELTIK